MYRLFFAIFVTCILAQLANSASLSNYQHELRQGRCTGERLVNEDLVKSGAPYTTRKLTYTWRGHNMYRIACINVYNKLDSSQAGSVRVLEGGVGQSEVILEMITKNGKGMHFHLEIYGQLTN